MELGAIRLRGGRPQPRRTSPNYAVLSEKAARSAHKREEAIKRVRKRLAAGIKGKGGPFLKVDQDAISLDKEDIANVRKFGGMLGVWTSLQSLMPQENYAHHGQLWRIREGFRVRRHTMAVRSISRWVERRIRAHMTICFVPSVPITTETRSYINGVAAAGFMPRDLTLSKKRACPPRTVEIG